MACGIGACLCCVTDTKEGHKCVCTEGPIFQYKKFKMADLNININSLPLKNPVLTASGTFGYGTEFQLISERLGRFIVKGTTLKHREGNPYPGWPKLPSGMLNAVGLQNKGVDYFIDIFTRR